MTSEESAEYLKEFCKNTLKGTDPKFMEVIKKAIEVLIIDASKQKMKEYLKQKENKNEYNGSICDGNGKQGEGRDGI